MIMILAAAGMLLISPANAAPIACNQSYISCVQLQTASCEEIRDWVTYCRVGFLRRQKLGAQCGVSQCMRRR